MNWTVWAVAAVVVSLFLPYLFHMKAWQRRLLWVGVLAGIALYIGVAFRTDNAILADSGLDVEAIQSVRLMAAAPLGEVGEATIEDEETIRHICEGIDVLQKLEVPFAPHHSNGYLLLNVSITTDSGRELSLTYEKGAHIYLRYGGKIYRTNDDYAFHAYLLELLE